MFDVTKIHSYIKIFGLGLFCFIFLHGCAVQVPMLEIMPAPPIKSKFVSIKCDIQPSWEKTFKEYELPKNVLDVSIDSSGVFLGVIYKDMDKNRSDFLVISCTNELVKPSFRVPAGTIISNIKSGIVNLQEPLQLLMININSGETKKLLPGTYSYGQFENEMIHFSKDSVSLLDQNSGKLLWKGGWALGEDYLIPRYWRVDDQVFVASGGLWRGSVADGRGWFYKAKTANVSNTRRIAAGILGIVGSALTGQYYSNNVNADVTAGLRSNPLIDKNDKVLFASAEHLSCLSAQTGEIIWQRPRSERVGISSLIKLDDNHGVLVEYGHDLHNGELRETKSPYASAFDIRSGDEIWRFVPDPLCPINEVTNWNGFFVLLTDSALYVIDQTGNLRLNKKHDSDFKPTKLAVRDSLMIVLGGKVIETWKWGSFKKAWQKHSLGSIQSVFATSMSIGILDAILNRGPFNNQDFLADRKRLWIMEKGALAGYNINTGECERYVKLKYDSFWLEQNHLILYTDKRVGILQLNSLFEGLSQ